MRHPPVHSNGLHNRVESCMATVDGFPELDVNGKGTRSERLQGMERLRQQPAINRSRSCLIHT